MRAASFAYCAPRRLEEVIDLLQAAPASTLLLAGGQSLVPAMLARTVQVEAVVDLRHVGLDRLEVVTDHQGPRVRIGAMVRQAEIERSSEVLHHVPLLARASTLIGYRATRSRGTIGGSVAHGDGRAELPLALTALDATMTIAGPQGERTLPVTEFQASEPLDRLHPGELVIGFTVDPARWTGHAFVEQSPRRRGFALASAAVLVEGRDRVRRARVCVGAVADRPVLLTAAGDALAGREWADIDDASALAVAEAAAAQLDPPSDFHASGEHRRVVVTEMLRRAISSAVNEARQDHG